MLHVLCRECSQDNTNLLCKGLDESGIFVIANTPLFKSRYPLYPLKLGNGVKRSTVRAPCFAGLIQLCKARHDYRWVIAELTLDSVMAIQRDKPSVY